MIGIPDLSCMSINDNKHADIPRLYRRRVPLLKPGGAMLRHACCKLAATLIKRAYQRLLRFKYGQDEILDL